MQTEDKPNEANGHSLDDKGKIVITLPLPPSVNGLFGGGSGQKRFPSKEYKAWLAVCPKLEATDIQKAHVMYDIFFPDKRARDITNYIKAAEDYIIKSGVLPDDNYNHIPSVWIRFGGIDKTNPRIIVTINKQS